MGDDEEEIWPREVVGDDEEEIWPREVGGDDEEGIWPRRSEGAIMKYKYGHEEEEKDGENKIRPPRRVG